MTPLHSLAAALLLTVAACTPADSPDHPPSLLGTWRGVHAGPPSADGKYLNRTYTFTPTSARFAMFGATDPAAVAPTDGMGANAEDYPTWRVVADTTLFGGHAILCLTPDAIGRENDCYVIQQIADTLDLRNVRTQLEERYYRAAP